MIVEIVKFELPPKTNREAALNLYQQSTGKWLSNPDLIQKYYFFDEERALGGGVYYWQSREAMERWHGTDYSMMVRKLYGSEPQIEVFDALLHLDPSTTSVSRI
ncbi:hypothetical protein GCM10007094_01650 [Pseudovibrio japonicus]|uniref:Monooxygenase n=1 Tax=Pseudovibrio japonicus TaxID=366534 RepID=A0ABQ3DZQ1_9HYPH|nr:hypothetical protein [Pseudovibrio japonicus]GHB17720.1 hypothetical protein GCM10007094_01650 [Pseudovibrio japonicus]